MLTNNRSMDAKGIGVLPEFYAKMKELQIDSGVADGCSSEDIDT
jgi:hypothetical protein